MIQKVQKTVGIPQVQFIEGGRNSQDKCQRSRRDGNSRKFTDSIVDVPIMLKRQCQGCSKDLINKAEAQLNRVRSSADTGSSERMRTPQRSSHEWYAGHSIALSGVTAVSPMHTNARLQSDAVQRCRKIRRSVRKQVRRQV